MVLLCAGGPTLGQNASEGVELAIEPLAGNIYMVQIPGGGANIKVFVGQEGVLIFAHNNTRLRFPEEKSHFPRQGGSFFATTACGGEASRDLQ